MAEIVPADITPREVLIGLKKNYFSFLDGLIKKHGPIFSIPLRPHTAIIVEDPTLIQHILVDNKDNYIKGADVLGTSFNYMKAVLGDTLILMDNPALWTKHRRIVMPSLQRVHYKKYGDTIVTNCLAMIQKWNEQLKTNPIINIHDSLTELTLHSLLNTIFDASDLNQNTVLEVIALLKAKNHEETFKKVVMLFDKLIGDFIQRRIDQGVERNDLLDLFLRGYQDELGNKDALVAIRNELKGFIFAGHETVATSLTWTLYLLAKHREFQQVLANESAEVLGGQTPGYDDVERLIYTQAIYKESLRLYPPVYNIPRVAVDNDKVNGLTIPKGAYIMIPIFYLQRDPKYWKQPDKFIPERFIGENLSMESQSAFLPFGLGPRSCIGREFGTMEACLELILMISKFQFTLPESFVLEMTAQNVLLPKQELELEVARR